MYVCYVCVNEKYDILYRRVENVEITEMLCTF
jgi:hypothetical protein